MTKGSINLSPKYGVNPSILHCFICGKETGLALLGKLKNDAEAPHDISNPSELCDDSEKTFSQLEKGDYIYAIENNYVLAKYKINHIYQDVYSYYSQAVSCLCFVLENRISDIYIPKCNINSVHSEIFYTSLDLAVSDFKKALNKN